MNYHYIEYMLKERQKDELRECARIRMLKNANMFPENGLQKFLRYFSAKLCSKKCMLIFRLVRNF